VAKKPSRPLHVELRLGSIPADAINSCLGLEIEIGEVIFSVPAQMHAARQHPEDFPVCLPHTGTIVSAPLYVGNDFKNHGKIELISKIPALQYGILVAIHLETDASGCYNVVSLFPISYLKIESRLSKGFLKRVVKK
jgi:hypothetical protein